MTPITKKGLHLNNLKLLRANYYTDIGGINLFAPQIEISDSYTIVSGVDKNNVHVKLKFLSTDLSLIGVSVAFAGVYNQANYGKTSYGSEKILSDKYRVETSNGHSYLTLFYENPNIVENFSKTQNITSDSTVFSSIETAFNSAFEEALNKRKEAVQNYNTFVNRNVNRPNISKEIKNETPKEIGHNKTFEVLKEFFMNNKEEIKKMLDLD